MTTHPQAVSSALLAVSGMGHRAWARNVGVFVDMRGSHRRLGVKGEADIQGILRGGYALAIEVKTGHAFRTPHQRAWSVMWLAMGGCYVLARYSEHEEGDAAIRYAIERYLSARSPGTEA